MQASSDYTLTRLSQSNQSDVRTGKADTSPYFEWLMIKKTLWSHNPLAAGSCLNFKEAIAPLSQAIKIPYRLAVFTLCNRASGKPLPLQPAEAVSANPTRPRIARRGPCTPAKPGFRHILTTGCGFRRFRSSPCLFGGSAVSGWAFIPHFTSLVKSDMGCRICSAAATLSRIRSRSSLSASSRAASRGKDGQGRGQCPA